VQRAQLRLQLLLVQHERVRWRQWLRALVQLMPPEPAAAAAAAAAAALPLLYRSARTAIATAVVLQRPGGRG
jgi:hypothetical protein